MISGSTPLICIPYAGGSASIYRGWDSGLSEEIDVVSLELPGRGRRHEESPITEIDPLVETLAQEILPNLDRSWTIFGHSLGALIAFELVRRLRRDGAAEPGLLIVSACPGPSQPGGELTAVRDQDEALRHFGGTPEQLAGDAELLAWKAEVLMSDLETARRYVYREEEPLTCPILALIGASDRLVDPASIGAWRQETSGDFHRRRIPGDHFFLHSAERFVLQLIDHEIRALRSDG